MWSPNVIGSVPLMRTLDLIVVENGMVEEALPCSEESIIVNLSHILSPSGDNATGNLTWKFKCPSEAV